MVPAWVGLAHGLRSRAHGPKFIVFPNHDLTRYQQLVSASSTTLQAFSSKRLSNGFVPFNFDIAFVPFNRIKLQQLLDDKPLYTLIQKACLPVVNLQSSVFCFSAVYRKAALDVGK